MNSKNIPSFLVNFQAAADFEVGMCSEREGGGRGGKDREKGAKRGAGTQEKEGARGVSRLLDISGALLNQNAGQAHFSSTGELHPRLRLPSFTSEGSPRFVAADSPQKSTAIINPETMTKMSRIWMLRVSLVVCT